jgi:alkylation response protein AidB-like acyl-CoA dehydrogenase
VATLDLFRATVGTAALGFAHRALDEAGRRTKNRNLFGALRLLSLQMVQGHVAEMAVNIVEQHYREICALRIYKSTSEVQKVVITRQILSGVCS